MPPHQTATAHDSLPEPCRRLCVDISPNAAQRLYRSGVAVLSNPEISWLQKENPLIAKESPPRKRLCHGRIICRAVAAPVYRELLSACRRTPREQYRFLLSLYFFQKIEHCLVVQISIVIVHRLRITAIIVNNIHRNTLAEIRLEAVHTAVQNRYAACRYTTFTASGFVKSTSPIPACQLSVCHTPFPSARCRQISVFGTLFYKNDVPCAMYGLIHAQIFRPFS